MPTYTLPNTTIQAAMIEATRVLIQNGPQMTYQFNDGTPSESFKVLKQKLREEELVGDFEQGDCRLYIDATEISKAPEKYDTIIDADGTIYALVDYLSCDVGYGGTTMFYKPVGRA